MALDHPFILYIGSAEQGVEISAAAEAREWAVSSADQTDMALGMYMMLMPDVTIIDEAADEDMTADVLYHLRSVDAKPILIVSDNLGWRTLAGEGVETAPTGTHIDLLLDHAGELAGEARALRRHAEIELIAELA